MKMPKVPTVVYAAISIVALVWLYFFLDRRADRKLGEWQGIAKRLQRDSAENANAIKRADSVFVRDTITLTRVATRFRTVVDSLVRTDTALVHDSVFVRVTGLADSTLKACYDALNSCSARVAARDTLIRTLGEQREADRELFNARLRTARPFLTPYVEAGAVLTESQTYYARAGAEMRVIGAIRLTGALEATKIPNHTTTAARVGLRVNFR